MLQPGQPAPDFSVQDETGKTRSLSEFKGQTVVLWFFPKADTPGCTAEGCGFRDRYADFRQRGVTILGASFDTAEENRAFKEKYGFPFPLLCDTDRKLGMQYGAATDANAKNAVRTATVIGPDGRILAHHPKVDAKTFPQTVLESLGAAQA